MDAYFRTRSLAARGTRRAGLSLERLEQRLALAAQPTAVSLPPQLVSFPTLLVDGEIRTSALPRFDASLGTLVGVTISASGRLDGRVEIENAIDQIANADVSIGGGFELSALGIAPLSATFSTTSVSTLLPAFDGAFDFAGPGLVTTGPDSLTAQASVSRALASPGDNLAGFVGTGSFDVAFLPSGIADVADANGNVLVATELSASAEVSVTYVYVPYALAGVVYVDANGDGLHGVSEPGIAGVTLTLTGTTTGGAPVGPISTTTDANGEYFFGGLQAGTYDVVEVQPAGYLDGQETRGNITPIAGSAGDDQIATILVGPENPFAPQNNFGELLPAARGTVLVTPMVRGIHAQMSVVTFQFTSGLDPARAANVANYRIATSGPDGRFQTADDQQIAIADAEYDAATRTVAIHPGARLNLNQDYMLIAKGPGGVLADGLDLIDGFGGRGDFVTIVQRGKSLKYQDVDGDKVSLKVSRGGVLVLFRGIDNRATRLYALHGSSQGERLKARKSTLSGTVQRASAGNNKAMIPSLVTAVSLKQKWRRTQIATGTVSVAATLPTASL